MKFSPSSCSRTGPWTLTGTSMPDDGAMSDLAAVVGHTNGVEGRKGPLAGKPWIARSGSQATDAVDREDQVSKRSVVGRRLLAVRETAEYLGVSVASVERLVYRGRLPFVRIGGSTRYDICNLDVFIESNRQRNRRRVA